MHERLVPLSDIAYELNISTKDLERRCNGGFVTDELGLRCVPGSLVIEPLAQRDAELERQRQRRAAEREQAQRQKAQRDAERAALAALHEQQAPLVQQGLSAHEIMLLSAGEFERRADESPTGDYLAGGASYRTPKGPE